MLVKGAPGGDCSVISINWWSALIISEKTTWDQLIIDFCSALERLRSLIFIWVLCLFHEWQWLFNWNHCFGSTMMCSCEVVMPLVFTRGQFWPSGIVIACVCVSVRVSVCVYQSLACPHDNSSAVHARITKFGWETQNTLVKMPIILGGDRPWPSRSNLTWKSNFTSFWACPHDNFSLVSVRITKYGPEMHLSMVKKPIVLGVDWPWSSMSNLICKSNFIPFWACPYNNLSSVQATITKFGPEMHLNTVKIPVDFGRDKPSASILFLIVKAIFFYLFALFLYHI